MASMRKFHIITYNTNDPEEQVVEKYEKGNFNYNLLKIGIPYQDTIPAEVKLYIDSRSHPTDFLANPLSWPIVSEKFLKMIKVYARDDIQVFDAPVFDNNTRKPVKGFYILNVVKLIRAVDFKHSTVMWEDKIKKKFKIIIKYVFQSKKIPVNVHIFRPAEDPFGVFFSDELATSLIGKGLKGIAFIRTRSV